jgi:FkbM family methyltransferase
MKIDFENLSNSNIYIYGTGSFGRDVFELCIKLEINVEAFIDHVENPNFSGKRTITPQEIPDSKPITVVLGVCNLFGDLESIANSLIERNPNTTIISPVTFAQICGTKGLTLDNYWLTSDSDYIKTNLKKIDSLKLMLSDEASQNLVDEIINYRLHGNVIGIPKPDQLQNQYLPEDLNTPPESLRMLELGSFKGEDIIRFDSRGKFIEFAFCLEPDLENYQALVSEVNNAGLKNVFALPVGAWKKTTQLKFNASGQTGAQLNDSAYDSVLVMKLDNLVGQNSINYIKMDIEGAEAEAIEGLYNTIKSQKPHLAISVYHKPDDLWEIPLKIQRLFPDTYNSHIRVYGHQTFDTVLYCIPKNTKF